MILTCLGFKAHLHGLFVYMSNEIFIIPWFSNRVAQIPGCILAAILGIVVDVHVITMIVLLKAPLMLLKGWHRLIQDLIGREGPFLETVCVPFASLWILLWPIMVLLAIAAGIISSLGFGCFAAVVAYQVKFDYHIKYATILVLLEL